MRKDQSVIRSVVIVYNYSFVSKLVEKTYCDLYSISKAERRII